MPNPLYGLMLAHVLKLRGAGSLRFALHPVEAVSGEDEQRNRDDQQGSGEPVQPGMQLHAEYPRTGGQDAADQCRANPTGKAKAGADRFPIQDGVFGALFFHRKSLRPAR